MMTKVASWEFMASQHFSQLSNKLKQCILLASHIKLAVYRPLKVTVSSIWEWIYPLHSYIITEQLHQHHCFFLESPQAGPIKIANFQYCEDVFPLFFKAMETILINSYTWYKKHYLFIIYYPGDIIYQEL